MPIGIYCAQDQVSTQLPWWQVFAHELHFTRGLHTVNIEIGSQA